MRAFDGYPTSFGDKKASVFPHHGPTSYTTVTVGPLAGGDTVQSGPEGGPEWLDFLAGGVTDSGQFVVLPIPINSSVTSSTGPLSGPPAKTYKLLWMSLVTGAVGGQVQTAGTPAVATTDLSTQTVRLFGIGPK